MPWSAAQMAAKGAHRPAIAARAANDHYRRCRAKGGSDTTCAPSAIRIGLAASNVGQRRPKIRKGK